MAVTYTVKPGDWLSKIAPKFGVSWQQIYQANRNIIKNPNLIYPGQVLTIPVGGGGGGARPQPAVMGAATATPSASVSVSPVSTPTVSPPSARTPWVNYVKKYFPRSEWERAIKVFLGESGGNPRAIGDVYPIRGQLIPSYGIAQIRALPGRPSPQELLDPEKNIQYAAQLWRTQGWKPWTVARELGYVPGYKPKRETVRRVQTAYKRWLEENRKLLAENNREREVR